MSSAKNKAIRKSIGGKMMKVVYGGPKPSDMFDAGERMLRRYLAKKKSQDCNMCSKTEPHTHFK